MKKLLVLFTLTLAGCSSFGDDDLSRYENICTDKMGICSADSKRMDRCINELRKLEDENAKIEYITEYKTEYKCCNAPETRTERRVEYKNKVKQEQYEYSMRQANYTSAVSSNQTAQIPSRKGCTDTVINGMKVERCVCSGREPVICYEQIVNNRRARRCEAEVLFNKR